MKISSRLTLLLLASLAFAGCETTKNIASATRDFVVGIYRATTNQKQVADQRATAAYNKMTPETKTKLKDSGTRYLAVRTADPTPEQMVEINATIKSEAKKPGGGRYGRRASTASSTPPKVYCVMVWDTVAKEVVGNNCYAVLDLPQPGLVAKFDVYTAQYVGAL